MSVTQIKLAETPDFDLGGLRVSPGRRQAGSNGKQCELEPKVAQVLIALASARPDVVSRDRLIERCWDGRIVGDDAVNRCIVALRHLAKQFSPEPFAIETVPRVGYSLIEHPSREPPAKRARNLRAAAVAALLLIATAAGLWTTGAPRFSTAEQAPASIAVLPFRNLSAGDPYFAEGIGEEVVGQLAHEPQFRVAGRASSSALEDDADFRAVARRLNVDYVLEGSVRRQGDRVRVNSDLVRVSDGMRLWSDSYDGKLDDIFAIQQRIGGAIATALRRRLMRTPPLTGALVTNGQTYNLYLTARGLIRTRKKDVFVTASNLLRDAINLDPNYAPAWASLAEATYLTDYPDGSEGLIRVLPGAVGYARHALKLAPDLADGHRVLGLLLPYGSAEALSHFRRAAELDPNNAEILIDLGMALGAEGQFDAEMAAYERARGIDPTWFRTTGQLAIRLAETGQRARAEAIADSGFASDPNNRHIILGRIAWIFGDYSEAARHWSIVAAGHSPRWSARAQSGVADAKAAVGLDGARARPKLLFAFSSQRTQVQTDAAPSAITWKMHNRNAIAADVYGDENVLGAKLMLKAGRAKELAATYDSPLGLLGLHGGEPLRADQLKGASVVALALRQAGRAAEADRLLNSADSMIKAIYRQHTIPFDLDADVAAVWAAQGRRDQALSMLERAVRRGWTDAGSTDFTDIADEPAFNLLRDESRFARIRASLIAHLARERSESESLHV